MKWILKMETLVSTTITKRRKSFAQINILPIR